MVPARTCCAAMQFLRQVVVKLAHVCTLTYFTKHCDVALLLCDAYGVGQVGVGSRHWCCCAACHLFMACCSHQMQVCLLLLLSLILIPSLVMTLRRLPAVRVCFEPAELCWQVVALVGVAIAAVVRRAVVLSRCSCCPCRMLPC